MKNLIYALAICFLVAGCEKYDSGQVNKGSVSKRLLSGTETILKENLEQSAEIMSEIIQNGAVMDELSVLYREDRGFYILNFSDLFDESKSISSSFRNLREKFLSNCVSSESKGSWQDLAGFLAKNGCYIYCPYPSNFYPKGTFSMTVAAHPIDNEFEGKGFRFEGRKIKEVTVNEEYADTYPVILIMPPDEKEADSQGMTPDKSTVTKADPVYEVKVGKVRCADYCGGIFEGDLELRITRGYPEYNLSTGLVTGTFSTAIPIKYPREYAKSAVKNWTIYCSGGWYSVFIPWDTNWKTSKTQEAILVYEYDSVRETSVSATVGYKPENSNTALTVTAKTNYSGDFLGINEWDRDWFYATNTKSGIYDEVKDGLTVRKTCNEFKLTTPSRTIY